MEKKIETTMVSDWGNIRAIMGLYGDNGEENGNYYNELSCPHLQPTPVLATSPCRPGPQVLGAPGRNGGPKRWVSGWGLPEHEHVHQARPTLGS